MRYKILNIKNKKGQALVTLLFIVLIGMTVISAAAIFVYENTKSTSIREQGEYAYFLAESGAEDALLRLLRERNYEGGSFSLGGGTVEIQVDTQSGLITSIGTFQKSVRKIEVQTVYNNYVLTVSSWKEVGQ